MKNEYTIYDKDGREIHKGDILKVWMGLEKCEQDSSYIVNDLEEFYEATINSDKYLRITRSKVIGYVKYGTR